MPFLSTKTVFFCIFAVCFNGAFENVSEKGSPWFAGCYNRSFPGTTRDSSKDSDGGGLKPVTCSQGCLNDGYEVTALSGETCYCGHYGMEGLVARVCPGSSKWCCCDSVCLPCGEGKDILVVYRTLGPYIRNVSLAVLTDIVHAGIPFHLEVSGYLAAPPAQPTGIHGLGRENLSFVDVQFSGRSLIDRSSHSIIIQEDGFFTFSSDWILENPGTYQINVSVSNLLSQLSSSLSLSALHPSPEGLEVSLVQGQGATPSCIPYTAQGTITQALEKAYLGDTLILLAYVGAGVRVQFHWSFSSDEDKLEEVRSVDVKTESDCQRSTVHRIFEREGVHTVMVNASNDYGWTNETIHIAVVRRVVSHLTLGSLSGYHLGAGQNVSLDLHLHSTQSESLLLNLTLTHQGEDVFKRDLVHIQALKYVHPDHGRDQNHDQTEGHNLNQNHPHIRELDHFNNFTFRFKCSRHCSQCHRDGHDTLSFVSTHTLTSTLPTVGPLRLLSTSSQTSCNLQFHLHYHLPTIVGQYIFSVAIFSRYNPTVPLLSASLPVMAYDCISSILPAGPWSTVVITRSELNLTVKSQAGHLGSNLLWTVVRGKTTVLNRTTEAWSSVMSFPTAGRYLVMVKAFNPISWASFHTHFLVQDPVGTMVLNIPSVFVVNETTRVLFTITTGSNMTVVVLVNTTVLYQIHGYTAGSEVTLDVVFDHLGSAEVVFKAENLVSSENRSVNVCVQAARERSPVVAMDITATPVDGQSLARSTNVHAVIISTEKQAYPTNTDITFQALMNEPDPVEFEWHFGDSKPLRTTSRVIKRRYQTPDRYSVVVVASNGLSSYTSPAHPILVQRPVRPNRLLLQPSVLLNHTASFTCRITSGTDLSYNWSFGEGTSRMGGNVEQHVFYRTGEFTVQVTVYNLISSTSLTAQMFVVDRPCQPPPVKNMGPLKIQVRRYETVRLGVTFEAEIQCDVFHGLEYRWSLYTSAGLPVQLPPTHTDRQSITLPRHFLNYGLYIATARVQMVSSVVYSNYSVGVEVLPSPPVSLIQGGSNVFLSRTSSSIISLNGQRSYDPDYPMNQLSYSWTCKPISVIDSSCFNQYVPTFFSVVVFPVGFLKQDFDQFRFSLTVQSGERTSTADTFITVTYSLARKVSLYWYQGQVGSLNWDQAFSARAVCESCGSFSRTISFTWTLYLVNHSSKVDTEVPFCHRVDLSVPSNSIGASVLTQPPALTVPPPVSPSPTASMISHPYAPPPTASMISHPYAPPPTASMTSDMSGISNTDGITSGSSSHSAVLANPSADPISSPISSISGTPEPDIGEHIPAGPSYPVSESPMFDLDDGSTLYSAEPGQSEEFSFNADLFSDYDFPSLVQEGGDVDGRPGLEYNGTLIGPSANQTAADNFNEYDVPFLGIEEGDPGMSGGRPTGVDGGSYEISKQDSGLSIPESDEDEGSDLMDASPSRVVPDPTILDLPRELVEPDLFDSYTYTGISSPLITLKAFTLRADSTYMLEVTAKSHDAVLGRTQLFLSTSPTPRGMTCQVQPISGQEIYTHFSIFCTSGREDLQYEYSFSIGGSPPTILYQGRDFQYYFNLPSGDPDDAYKVTIYTEVRNRFGAATRPCPVTVTVLPSLIRNTPNMELFESGLRNLSALVQLGNTGEVRNYVNLLSIILNRHSKDHTANSNTQTHTRTALINTVCQRDIYDQESMTDTIYMLKDLMQVTHEVSLASVSMVVARVHSISDQFHQPRVPVPYLLDSQTLNTLVTLLSLTLQAAAPAGNLRQQQDSADDIKQATPTEQAIQLILDSLQTTAQLLLKYVLFNKAQEHNVTTTLMDLQTTHHTGGLTRVIRSDWATFHLPDCLDKLLYGQQGRETSGGPQSLCVLSQLTMFTRNPHAHTITLTGPVIDLTLYNCSTRRKIPVRSLSQPINIEFPKISPNLSTVSKYTLLRSQMNNHSFNITQQTLQVAIQISVEFTRPPNKTFPIMLLFRMSERPTPSLFHIRSIYQWDRTTMHISLPPSYLKGTGYLALLNADYNKTITHRYLSKQVNYTLRLKTTQCLSWDQQQGWTRSGCTPHLGLSSHTHVSCSCSHLRPLTVVQHQIKSSHEDSGDLLPYISSLSGVTVVYVCVVCVCLYALGMVVCKRADVISERNQEVYYLDDNCPSDTHFYSVTIHTGLSSSTSMTAQVHIVLYGEDGASPTRQINVPQYPLFTRNSRKTFILSTADSLGPLWGLHLWHDNTGPSPSWYLRQVEVCELKDKGQSWVFLGQCWLAVDEGDGQVGRNLRVCDQGPGFTKLLYLKLSEYMSDFHLWFSVHSGPSPSAFKYTQRLSVCLLLFLGYMCVNTLLISGLEDQYATELGLIDLSVVSLTTGLLSVLAVLPVTTAVSFLFRKREVRMTRSQVKQEMVRLTDIYSVEAGSLTVRDCEFESYFSWNTLQLWAQEAWRKKYEVSVPNINLRSRREDLVSQGSLDLVLQDKAYLGCNSRDFEEGVNQDGYVPGNISILKERDHNLNDKVNQLGINQVGTSRRSWDIHSPVAHWSHLLAWAFCLVLGIPSLVVTIVFGIGFSSSLTLLWIQSLFFSMLTCVFLIQPAMILLVAVGVSFWHRKHPEFASFSGVSRFQVEVQKLWTQDGSCVPEYFRLSLSHQPQERSSQFDRENDLYIVLAARQRARYLRLVRPPTPGELRRAGGRRKRETLIQKTLREMAMCVSMLCLLLCMTYGSCSRDQYDLTHSVRAQFTRSKYNPFMSIQTHEEWWNWTLTSLLDGLFWENPDQHVQNSGRADRIQGTSILIGEPILWKIENSSSSPCQVPSGIANLYPECITVNTPGWRFSNLLVPLTVGSHLCGQLQRYRGDRITVRLNHTRSDCESRLESLRSAGWLERRTVVVATQFTLFNPSSNLFNSLTLLAESLPSGALHTSAHVESARVYHTPSAWHYFSMSCQLLLLVVSLVQLFLQICSASEKGMLGYCTDPQSWLQVSILLLLLVYYVYQFYQSVLTLEVIDQLQRHDFKTHVDLSLLSPWQQNTRTLRGVLLFLLVLRCFCLSGVTVTMATSVTLLRLTFSRLFWAMLPGAVLLVALFFMGNVLVLGGSSSLAGSLLPLLSLFRGRLPLSSEPHQHHSSNSLSVSFYHRALRLTLLLGWAALVMGIISSLVRAAKRASKRKSLLTLYDLASYVRERAAVFVGQRKWRRTDTPIHRSSFYLEEFEGLVDELLFRLNAFTNSLHHTLPLKDDCDREDSPLLSPTKSPSILASQHSAVSETTHITEETFLDNLPLTSSEDSRTFTHHQRMQLELKTLDCPQQRGQRTHTPALAGALLGHVGNCSCSLCSDMPGMSPTNTPSLPSNRNLQSSTSSAGPIYRSSPDLTMSQTREILPLFRSLTGWLDNQVVKTESNSYPTVSCSGGEIHTQPKNSHRGGVKIGPRQNHAPGVMAGQGAKHTTVVEVMVHRIAETEMEDGEEILGSVRECWN
ncbi:hypothetical protein UPYG_G00074250 [Umbra pygmaea]|uniref:Polycystic kidney disease protein 1-like 1 n=1 Tax=Umbra pygmaea TaxID=75934 RepID=A0ABD0XX15_UMBPY